MIDITKDIMTWISCCNNLWINIFKKNEDGLHDFYEIENALFSTLVISKLDIDINVALDEFYKFLIVEYQVSVDTNRQVCVQQKAGNIFCKNKCLSIKKGAVYPVNNIDSTGQMQSGNPCVQLKIDSNKFILERPENLIYKYVSLK